MYCIFVNLDIHTIKHCEFDLFRAKTSPCSSQNQTRSEGLKKPSTPSRVFPIRSEKRLLFHCRFFFHFPTPILI